MALAQIILGVLGNIAAFALFISPIEAIQQIRMSGSVQNFSVIPYLTAYLSSLFGFLYSLGAVTGKTNYLLLVVSVMGILFYGFYIWIFIRFTAIPFDKIKIGIYASIATVLVAGISVPGVVLHSETKRKNVVGYSMMAASVLANMAPVKVLGAVFHAKSVAGALPFYPTVAGLVNAIIWTLYSSIGTFTIFILVPNSVGVVMGLILLGAYTYFYFFGGNGEQPPNGNNPVANIAGAANGHAEPGNIPMEGIQVVDELV